MMQGNPMHENAKAAGGMISLSFANAKTTNFNLAKLKRAIVFKVAALMITITSSITNMAYAKEEAPAPQRDPNQLTVFITDLDGTFAENFGHILLFRPEASTDSNTLFEPNLPRVIRVSTEDWDEPHGARIKERIGRMSTNSEGFMAGSRGFIHGSKLDPITLSDGQVIHPGYYYFDPNRSYDEFRQGTENKLISALSSKLANKEPFLLEAASALAFHTDPTFADRTRFLYLSLRGHSEKEGSEFHRALQEQVLKQKTISSLPPKSFVNLTHPAFSHYKTSKTNYLQDAFLSLTRRNLASRQVPHFLVVFENDRKQLREIHELFVRLSNAGIEGSPVVPILVHVADKKVLDLPNGIDWDRNPDETFLDLRPVNVYWGPRSFPAIQKVPSPQFEKSEDLARTFQLSLQIPLQEARSKLASLAPNPFLCTRVLKTLRSLQGTKRTRGTK